MRRSAAALAASLTVLLLGIVLLVWFQIDWAGSHPGASATPLTALSDLRGQIGYLAGLAGVLLTFQSGYAIARRRAR